MNERYKKSAEIIYNGADIDRIRKENKDEIIGLKKKYGTGNKFIYGCIGNIEKWYDLDTIYDSFRNVKIKYPDSILMFIGPVANRSFVSKHQREEDIIFTGPVKEEEINDYFNFIDAGLLPLKDEEFLHYAFYLKIIEYSSARKPVISSDLEEVVKLKFPNIMIARSTDDWEKCLINARKTVWDNNWDSLIEQYDWSKIVKKLELLF